MKYLNEFQDHSNYTAFIVGSKFANIQTEKRDAVSYCINQNEVHFNPYVPKAKLLDILYSDANGNLSYTSEILPVSEGKTPIGLCIAGTGFFGTNEPARWMSLKYMNYETPDTGSLTAQAMYWGCSINISEINDISIACIQNNTDFGTLIDANYHNVDSSTPMIPSLFTENNEWNLSELGAVNQYAVTDIDGKNNTNKIISFATAQSAWQTDISIINNSSDYYEPTACCCWRYHTLGTNQGDWYFGAGGEICMLISKKTDINTKLTSINTVYPNDCINSLYNGLHWVSTEYNGERAYRISINTASIGKDSKNNLRPSLALLQY